MNAKTIKEFVILKEIRNYITPLSNEELFQLEKNILQEGCKDPLIVWENKGHLVLIDGHHRYKICQQHNLPFKTKKVSFNDLEEVKIWMVENQMGRRNLMPDQLSYYRGLRYLSLKKKKGGYNNVKSKGQSEISTSEYLASNFNVSESTVKRDAKYAEGLNIIDKSNPALKLKILKGEAKVKKTDIQILTNCKNPDKLIIKNEADLFNKAKLIKDEILSQVETRIKKIERDKIENAQELLNTKEPLFLSYEDRLKRIKGMIISAINRAINQKDVNSIKELKKLIEKLSNEILS